MGLDIFVYSTILCLLQLIVAYGEFRGAWKRRGCKLSLAAITPGLGSALQEVQGMPVPAAAGLGIEDLTEIVGK